MNRLIRAELFKMLKNNTFKIVCVVALVISIGMTIISSPLMHKSFTKAQEAVKAQEAYEELREEPVAIGSMGVSYTPKDYYHPKVSEVFAASFGVGVFEILASIIVGAFLAKEYSQGTIKNVLAYGRKRSDYYIAKFIALILAGIVVLLCLTSVATIGSYFINGWGEAFELSQVLRMAQSFGAAVIAEAAVISIIMLISIVIKSNGGVIGVAVGVVIGSGSLLSILYGRFDIFDKIFKFTPYYNDQLATSALATSGDVVRAMAVSLITMAIFLVAGCIIFKKQDIR